MRSVISLAIGLLGSLLCAGIVSAAEVGSATKQPAAVPAPVGTVSENPTALKASRPTRKEKSAKSKLPKVAIDKRAASSVVAKPKPRPKQQLDGATQEEP